MDDESDRTAGDNVNNFTNTKPPVGAKRHTEMNTLHVEYTAEIEAEPDVIYGIFADYRTSHPAILPKQYFKALTVEQGGVGAGTVVSGTVRVYGMDYPFHLVVSEPEPGYLLVETDTNTQQVTKFILEPISGGRTRVTIASDFPVSTGFAGFVERLTKPGVTRRIYQAELEQVAAYVRTMPEAAVAI